MQSALTTACALASFWLLNFAMRTFQMATAYAVWVGIGAVGTATVVVILPREPVSLARVSGILPFLGE